MNNIVYCGFATNLAALTSSKSDNIPVPYASLWSLILLLSSIELRLFSLTHENMHIKFHIYVNVKL